MEYHDAARGTVAKLKRAVRRRDGFLCTECGMTNSQHLELTGKQLQVHRRTPGSAYTLEDCVTLCWRCHGPKPRSEPVRRAPKSPPQTKATLYVEMPEDLKKRLDALAARRLRKITAEAILAIRKHVDEEDAKDGLLPKPDATTEGE